MFPFPPGVVDGLVGGAATFSPAAFLDLLALPWAAWRWRMSTDEAKTICRQRAVERCGKLRWDSSFAALTGKVFGATVEPGPALDLAGSRF